MTVDVRRSWGSEWRSQDLNPDLCAFSFTLAQLRKVSSKIEAEKSGGCSSICRMVLRRLSSSSLNSSEATC